jgi:hypothetical protein
MNLSQAEFQPAVREDFKSMWILYHGCEVECLLLLFNLLETVI